MHLVKLVASKGARIWEPKGRICGSVVRRRVMSLIIFLDPSDASTSYPFMHEHLFECKCLYMTATAQLQGKATSVSTVV